MRAPDISAMDLQGLLDREWLATNGLGGFACSTLCGLNTRKYHGLLVAAMSPPARRMVLLAQVDETVSTLKGSFSLSSNEYPGAIFPGGYRLLRAFSSDPFPRWAFQGDGFTIEKSLHLLPNENTVCLTYSLLAGDQSVQLEIRPLMALRGIHELGYQWNGRLAAEAKTKGRVRIAATSRTPEVFFAHDAEYFEAEPFWYLNTIHRRETERGYGGLEDLWNPGLFRWTLAPGQTCHLVCSTEPVEVERICGDLERLRREVDRRAAETALSPDETLSALERASEGYIVGSLPESEGDREVFVIAQYPWSAPSGRAALMAFSGMFLVTSRFDEARLLLISLAAAMRDGLIPTEFSETAEAPKYCGADTSLWFILAVSEYLRYSNDETTVRELLPTVEGIIAAYRLGTRLGIRVDSEGLLRSDEPGTPTTWMDAKVGEWVMTPRQGCPVELNALWFNAARIASQLTSHFGKPAQSAEYTAFAESVKRAFNLRFWNQAQNCCFDVIDGPGIDASIRPNQLLAISLPNAVLDKEHHLAVLETVIRELLTPLGLRTLSPRDGNYQGRYRGEVVARDRAQHQGSVFPWLLGPLVTAYMRCKGRDAATIGQVRRWLEPCINRLQGDGMGQLGELFDGDSPHHPGGAIASALSVGEILRCYAQDVLGLEPAPRGRSNNWSNPSSGIKPMSTMPRQ